MERPISLLISVGLSGAWMIIEPFLPAHRTKCGQYAAIFFLERVRFAPGWPPGPRA